MQNQKETREKINSRIEELKKQINTISTQIENDRLENGEDDEAIRRELLDKKDFLEQKVTDLQSSFATLDISTILGKKFKVNMNGVTRTIEIVHPTEADPRAGKISIDSPLAQALEGNGAGDNVKVETPIGIQEYVILQVSG